MIPMTRRRACLGMLLLAGSGSLSLALPGCGSGELPSVPEIPKDYKPVAPAPTGVAPMPKNKRKRGAAGSNES